MNYETIEFKNIGETMHKYSHKSGLNAFVIPKKGYSKKYAVFAAYYGSINTDFIQHNSDDVIKVPQGIAHFLEHKLFDQKEGSIMDKFSALGSEPNAYTSFNQTVYLFSCTDRFTENFNLLLSFVQNPFFTEQSVEKEKSIIKQEIDMYADNPRWRSFFNFLKVLYKNNYVRNEILGTQESIDRITKDNLYMCYNNFYNMSNMVVSVVGDVETDSVFSQIENSILNSENKLIAKRIFPEEPQNINEPYIEEKMQVSIPLFQMGFKDNFNFSAGGKELLKRENAMKILLEIIIGRSSNLFISLYEDGLINNDFEFDYVAEENYAYSVINGESQNPLKVKERILECIDSFIYNGISQNDYERVKKAMYGRTVRGFNSVENISGNFISAYFKGIYIFDYFDIYDKINFEYVNSVMKEHFTRDRFAMSVITPF
ncbi:MAG TPA: pitrilysin family protein [Clostridiales bacterium]|nr:pitrilysin family protein [Clostridiales bacterium]